jgi:hypothetical protein
VAGWRGAFLAAAALGLVVMFGVAGLGNTVYHPADYSPPMGLSGTVAAIPASPPSRVQLPEPNGTSLGSTELLPKSPGGLRIIRRSC